MDLLLMDGCASYGWICFGGLLAVYGGRIICCGRNSWYLFNEGYFDLAEYMIIGYCV